MYELDAGIGSIKADDRMPTAVAVMRFATFSNLDRGLHLQAFVRNLANQVRVALIVVVLENGALIHRVTENIRDQAAEVVSLS
ncbi:hypothetical protein [Candidatus Accumulibacter aalborgensis]|uniref:hypothetical protein n=1 Tax=Candidatus Accumulibacter aalborgensis TaxID=1860102 RepID=UPI001645D77D|nr:hypothetical protein [Candidatus Accumulibacter aalborgensis]